jgi:hypothetical protein
MLLAAIRQAAAVVPPPALWSRGKYAAVERRATLDERSAPGALGKERPELCERAGTRRPINRRMPIAERHDALLDQQAPGATGYSG